MGANLFKGTISLRLAGHGPACGRWWAMPLYHLCFVTFLYLLKSLYLEPQFFPHLCSCSSLPHPAGGKQGRGVGRQWARDCLILHCRLCSADNWDNVTNYAPGSFPDHPCYKWSVTPWGVCTALLGYKGKCVYLFVQMKKSYFSSFL